MSILARLNWGVWSVSPMLGGVEIHAVSFPSAVLQLYVLDLCKKNIVTAVLTQIHWGNESDSFYKPKFKGELISFLI